MLSTAPSQAQRNIGTRTSSTSRLVSRLLSSLFLSPRPSQADHFRLALADVRHGPSQHPLGPTGVVCGGGQDVAGGGGGGRGGGSRLGRGLTALLVLDLQ